MRNIHSMKAAFSMATTLRRAGIILALSASLGGCSLSSFVSSGPVPDLYALTPVTPDAGVLAASRAQVVVMPFSAPGALDTDRIAVQPNVLELKYYEAARWTDTAPQLVQSLTVASLQNMNRFAGVSRLANALRADYVLSGDIRRFSVDHSSGNAGQATVELVASITDQATLRMLATREFRGTADVGGKGDMLDIATAFNKAMSPVLNDMSLWALETIDKASPASGALTQ